MDFINRHKNIVIFLAIAVLFFVIYVNFFSTDSASEQTLNTTSNQGGSVAAQAAERELLAVLLQLRNIELDESIFEDELFQRLQDFSQEIVPEPTGRPNPFAPLGFGTFSGGEELESETEGAIGTE